MYQPPKNLWDVNRGLQLDELLDGDEDPRWVDTGPARGEYSLRPLYRTLGVSDQGFMGEPPDRGYYLFCGHRGCGKSTELRRLRRDLHRSNRYYVVFADATRELDVNNLRYQDVLLHLASKLVTQLTEDQIGIEATHLKQLENWFTERVEKREQTREFAVQAKTGTKVEPGIPFLGKVFGEISSALRTNSTYKQELRRTLQNYFKDFAEAFNQLIEAADGAIKASVAGQRLLFVIDGTDRLRDDDARAFFVADIHQLQQVRGLFLYCAPIHLTYEAGAIGQNFSNIFHLPMMKIENADGSPNEAGLEAMRNLLHRRAATSLFDGGVDDYLIEHSGGHPRDLLRLLQFAFTHAEADRFDIESAKRAVRQAASEFRRILDPDDYELLARIDADPAAPPHSDQARRLLYNLALLEYNDYYWRSHPLVRTTEDYQNARSSG